MLSNLIQEIEPLNVSLIQKDVLPTTVDAMKRTISGMLGLLPSDQFQVVIEALWEPLSKLLVSSMMTGYAIVFVYIKNNNLDFFNHLRFVSRKRELTLLCLESLKLFLIVFPC